MDTPEMTEATESSPYGLSQAGFNQLRTAFRGAMIAGPGFGIAFGLASFAMQVPRLGLAIGLAGALFGIFLLLRKQCFLESTTCTFQFTLVLLLYVQFCFITPALIVATRLTKNAFSVLLFPLMGVAVFFYARYYYRACWRAWNAKKQYNETEALDLEEGFYFPAEQFEIADVRSLGWDEKIGKALCVIGPMGGAALGVVAGRSGEIGTFTILLAAFSFFISMVWSQVTVRGIINLRKIRCYEREIGRPIRNR